MNALKSRDGPSVGAETVEAPGAAPELADTAELPVDADVAVDMAELTPLLETAPLTTKN